MGEAEVYIDGVRLTDAQVMTLRAALSSFSITLKDEGLGEDEHGKAMTNGYLENAKSIQCMLVAGGNRPDRLASRRRAF